MSSLLLGAGAAGGFVPASLVARWRGQAVAGVADGDGFSPWLDIAGGHDLTNVGDLRPTYSSADINGLPVVNTGGASGRHAKTAAFAVPLPYTVYAVLRVGSAGFMLDWSPNHYVQCGTTFVRIGTPSTTADLAVDTAPARVYTVECFAGTTRIRVDGSGTTASAAGAEDLTMFGIGTLLGGTVASPGFVRYGEILVCAAERDSGVEAALKDVWGTP